jgi:hypothetical protein
MEKKLKVENKVAVVKLAKASPALAEMKEALQMSNMEGSISQVTSTPPPPYSPRKRGRLLSPENRRCRRRVLSGMVAIDTDEPGSLAPVKGLNEEDPSPHWSSAYILLLRSSATCRWRKSRGR